MSCALRFIPSENDQLNSDSLVNFLRIFRANWYPEYEGVCEWLPEDLVLDTIEEKTRSHERSFGLFVMNTANRRSRGCYWVIGVYDKQKLVNDGELVFVSLYDPMCNDILLKNTLQQADIPEGWNITTNTKPLS